MLLKDHDVYCFGEFTLDPVAKVLFRNAQPVPLTRKAAETLLVLVEHPGQVLTKDEIRAAVWADRVVDDANLAQNIAVVRKALGVEKGNPAYIETFPGRGYRLQGPVTAPVAKPEAEPVAEVAPEAVVVAPVAAVAPAGRRPWVGLAAAAVLVVGAVAWVSWPSSVEAVPKVSALSRLPGKEYQPAVSPDGTRTAFLWQPEGAGAAQVWTEDGQISTGAASSPAWSGDGRRVAYLKLAGGLAGAKASVVIAPETVVTEVRLPEVEMDSRLLAWSPDGSSFVVSRAEGLAVIDAASGAQRSLTQGFDDVAPRYSPDGKQVAFLRVFHRGSQEVFVIPLAGGRARQLTNAGRPISDVDWSQDGRSLLAAMNRESEFRLWRLGLDGGAPVALGIYGDSPIQFALARRSERLVYAQLQQDRNIWRLDLAGLTWRRVVASTAQDASPQYSPDGQWICFRSDRSGAERLWVARADGSGARAVTGEGLRPSVGKWAPDSRQIVFNDPHTAELYVTDRETGVARALGAKGVHPVYSPDGRWIYAGGTERLVRMPVGGGAAETVLASKGVSLDLSGDGKTLYFVRDPKEAILWRTEVGSGKLERAVEGLVPGCSSCWALDRAGIYYLGGPTEQTLFYREWASGRVRTVLRYPEFLWPLGSGPFSLAPDGKSLLTVRVDPSPGDVLLVTPFR
jgi:Tol biopolymer transport system component/DNA-binding winged helix-turn-helix (wHTH) protein